MAKKYFSYYLILTGNQKNEDEMITCFHSSISLNENRRSLCTPLAHVFYLLGTQLCHMTMGLGCAQHPEVQRSILKDCHLQPEASAVLWRGHPTALPGWRLLRGAVCGGRPKVQHFFFLSLYLEGNFLPCHRSRGPYKFHWCGRLLTFCWVISHPLENVCPPRMSGAFTLLAY